MIGKVEIQPSDHVKDERLIERTRYSDYRQLIKRVYHTKKCFLSGRKPIYYYKIQAGKENTDVYVAIDGKSGTIITILEGWMWDIKTKLKYQIREIPVIDGLNMLKEKKNFISIFEEKNGKTKKSETQV